MIDRNSEQPTLYMIVGLPSSGKTTKAKEIEFEQSALRFTPDEWILTLYGDHLDRAQRDAVRNPVEAIQWKVAKRTLELGCNVVLDWGFWTKAERMNYRRRAETLGAKVRIVFLDVSLDELWSRISGRIESGKGTLQITRRELEHWSSAFEAPSEEEL